MRCPSTSQVSHDRVCTCRGRHRLVRHYACGRTCHGCTAADPLWCPLPRPPSFPPVMMKLQPACRCQSIPLPARFLGHLGTARPAVYVVPAILVHRKRLLQPDKAPQLWR